MELHNILGFCVYTIDISPKLHLKLDKKTDIEIKSHEDISKTYQGIKGKASAKKNVHQKAVVEEPLINKGVDNKHRW